jgi:2-polyprenyl-3-methyl-5-hydroxy-6-metoxy-1,4-benzoquinol methylase
MKPELLELLRCPTTGQPLVLDAEGKNSQELEPVWLVSEDGRNRYPIINGIPRFAPPSNYADNFGMQWNYFRKTQLDSHSGLPISTDRFWKVTGWLPEALQGQWVLDVGCGAGRFAEVALQVGAKVVAVDFTNAVDACHANLQHHPNLHVVQGDIYSLPFAPGQFPFVYALGVLQCTPDVAAAFAALPPMVQAGGRLCVDYYEKSWKSILHPKHGLRPLTKRMRAATLLSLLQKAVPALLPLSRLLGAVPFLGGTLQRMVPVVNHHGVLPLTAQQHLEWSLLDTFDWLAPHYDHPQTAATARQWMVAAGMREIEVFKSGHLVARCKK